MKSILMLPAVTGERETRKQILLYSLLLLAVTMVLFAMGALWDSSKWCAHLCRVIY